MVDVSSNRPMPVPRATLMSIFKDMRVVRAVEKLFDLIPSELQDFSSLIAENTENISINTENIAINAGNITTLNSLVTLLITYQQRNIVVKDNDYSTNNEDDTIIINGSSNTVTISLNTAALAGKIHNLRCIDDTYSCIINGNGQLIDNEATFQIYTGESLSLQADSNNNWWMI